jgi:hypothetical protein
VRCWISSPRTATTPTSPALSRLASPSSPPRRTRRDLAIAAIAALVGVALAGRAGPVAAVGPESLPPGHWAYTELEHFEARGLVRLPGARPYSRHQVERWVAALARSAPALGAGERDRIDRLVCEFGDSLEAQRDDPPVVGYAADDWRFGGDIELASSAETVRGGAAGDAAATGRGHGRFETLLGWRDRVAYDTRYSVVVAEEDGARSDENRLSSRERNWHGLTSDNDRGYLAFERGPLRASLGRDYVAWGPRRGGELLLSDAGLSHDALTLRLRLRRFELSSVTGLLSASRERWLAAHRLDVDLGPVTLGVQEAAVYRSPNLEPAYLFPVSFYYGNQFNERADDNVLLGADVKCAGRWGTADAELLVDDFIYDGDPAPQKIGWRLGGGHVVAVGGGAVDLRADYTRVSRWTFTHRDSLVAYVAGGAAVGDPLLGTPLGPDADRIALVATWVPDARRQVWARGERTRRGDGNRDRAGWIPGTPHDLPFPSGRVERDTRVELGGRWRLGRRVECSGAGSVEAAPGGRRWGARAELRLDL